MFDGEVDDYRNDGVDDEEGEEVVIDGVGGEYVCWVNEILDYGC